MYMKLPGLLRMLTLVLLSLTVSGCEVIGTIFEAGLWVGGIFAVLVVGIIWFVASKLRRP